MERAWVEVHLMGPTATGRRYRRLMGGRWDLGPKALSISAQSNGLGATRQWIRRANGPLHRRSVRPRSAGMERAFGPRWILFTKNPARWAGLVWNAQLALSREPLVKMKCILGGRE